MARFYGATKGNRGEATRLGSAASGLTTIAASWNGAIRVRLYTDSLGRDCYRIEETPWSGRGRSRVIAEGIVGADTPQPNDGTSGQDRESYSDDQDRDSYTIK